MSPTYAGSIGCFMLTVWPYKCKVGHHDLIIIRHHIHLKNPKT